MARSGSCFVPPSSFPFCNAAGASTVQTTPPPKDNTTSNTHPADFITTPEFWLRLIIVCFLRDRENSYCVAAVAGTRGWRYTLGAEDPFTPEKPYWNFREPSS